MGARLKLNAYIAYLENGKRTTSASVINLIGNSFRARALEKEKARCGFRWEGGAAERAHRLQGFWSRQGIGS